MATKLRIYLIISLLFFPGYAFGFEEIENCEVEYYEILGNTEKKLLKEMKKKNNIPGGSFGYTSYSYKNHCTWLDTKCKVRIPIWKEYEKSKSEHLRANWYRFYSALIQHEQRHVDIFRKNIGDAIEKSKGKQCKVSNEIYKSAMKKIVKEQEAFDTETEHGIKKGAYFGGGTFYQAIAFSPKTGKYGITQDYSSKVGAEQAAIEYCDSSDCKIVMWAMNACASLATGKGNAYGTDWAKDSKTAGKKAMKSCKKYSRRCKVLKTVCPSD